jgi:hypothetical protein
VPSETTAAAVQDTSRSDTTATNEAVTHSNPDPTRPPTQSSPEEIRDEDVKLTLDGFTLDEATLAGSSMLPYLAMVATVIEGRTIGADELLGLLLRSMRQRSFDRLPRREYVLCVVNQHPP